MIFQHLILFITESSVFYKFQSKNGGKICGAVVWQSLSDHWNNLCERKLLGPCIFIFFASGIRYTPAVTLIEQLKTSTLSVTHCQLLRQY
jgi:hypothetical protein